jgi:uncharacterized protein YbaP (TraB family)
MFHSIKSPQGTTSYLFGTVTLNDKEVISLPLEVKLAFDNAKHCILETDLDFDLKVMKNLTIQWMSRQQKRFYKIEDRTPNNTPFNRYVFPVSPLIPLIPSALKKLMSPFADRLDQGLAYQLLANAKEKNKNITFLESKEKFICISLGLQLDYQAHLEFEAYYERNLAAKGKEALKELEATKNKYLNNVDIDLPIIPCTAPKAVHQFYQALLENRVNDFAASLNNYLQKEESFFIASPAFYLPSITKHLKQYGYEIEAQALSERSYQIADKLEVGKTAELNSQTQTQTTKQNTHFNLFKAPSPTLTSKRLPEQQAEQEDINYQEFKKLGK